MQAAAIVDKKLKENLDEIEKTIVFNVQEFKESKIIGHRRGKDAGQHGSPTGYKAEGKQTGWKDTKRTIPRHLRTRPYDRTAAKRQTEMERMEEGLAEY